MSDRLEAITRCTDELEKCRQHQGSDDQEVRFLCTLGEMDQRAELHRLIWETE